MWGLPTNVGHKGLIRINIRVWYRRYTMKIDIEAFQRIQLAVAEWFDAWRVFPRVIVGLYMALVYQVVTWYMALSDYIIPGCTSPSIIDCITQAPSTQHAALVTAVIGFSAAIFGFYANSGKQKAVPPKIQKPSPPRFPNKPGGDGGY